LDFSIFATLLQDGMTSGAIYALTALSLVLVFSVTRIIFVPQGEFVTYSALTFVALESNVFPATAWLCLLLGGAAFVLNLYAFARQAARTPDGLRRLAACVVWDLVLPLVTFGLALLIYQKHLGTLVNIALTMLLITPMGRYVYRLAYQRVAENSILLLLIVSVALHLMMVGIGLAMFGPEGARAQPLWSASFDWGALLLTGQSLLILLLAVVSMVLMYFYFSRTLLGAALKATAINRLGATLMGVETRDAGSVTFLFAAGVGALCGVLIASVTTIYYDSGFLIALKGFVGAIIGGLASYPVAAAGAVLVGVIESFSSFYASAYKEVLVFTLIIPVLLWMSLKHPQLDEGEE